MKGIQALITGAGFLLALLVLPFIWLYEQVGGPLFVVIVFGVPSIIWWYKKQAPEVGHEPSEYGEHSEILITETDAERKLRKKREAEEFHAQNKRRIAEREQQTRVHHIELEDGELLVDWQKQLEEINSAWASGDYDFARTWLQKLAYRLKSEDAPEAVHAKFKTLMAEFTRDDPLYAEVMRLSLPVIAETPGVIQSQLAKQFPQFDAEQFRYAMYYAEVIGDIVRTKKGRSYALSIPDRS